MAADLESVFLELPGAAEATRSLALTELSSAPIAASLVGYALAGALRHTAAALGIAFGYVLGGEVAIRAMWQGAAEPWLLSNHVLAWLQASCCRSDAATSPDLSSRSVCTHQVRRRRRDGGR